MLVWLVPRVGPLVTGVHVAVGAVARRRHLAQRHHLQPVLLARRHAVHYGQSAAGESAVGLIVTSGGRRKEKRRDNGLQKVPTDNSQQCFFPSADICGFSTRHRTPCVNTPDSAQNNDGSNTTLTAAKSIFTSSTGD